jgi:PAS domain S-box-containing protein
MTASFFPIWIIDVLGAVLMIVFSFLCLRLVRRLRKHEPENVIWTYLLWVCLGLAAFAISRSAGHILKQAFLLTGQETLWERMRPFTGAVNTLMFVFVASVTLFFERVWRIYQQISKDRLALQKAHRDMLYLNQNLEELVRDRNAALVLSEQKYRWIFESSQDMILVSDREGLIREINPAGLRLLDLAKNGGANREARFQPFFSRADQWRELLQMLESKGSVANTEVTLRGRGGKTMRTLVSASLDRTPLNEEEALHFTVRNVEKQRRIQEQMAQADKLASIGELSAGIAHEINNPLGIILGYTQLLLRGEEKHSERHADLKTIEKHVRSCKSIVEDLLSFARTSAPQKETVNLNDTMAEVLHFIQQHSNLGGIAIQTDYAEHLPRLLLDEKKIRQVLMNLVMNALHAVGEAGTIRITTSHHLRAGRVSLRVEDTGYGIDEKNLGRIFDPFFTTKPTGEGTGLGLSVSYGIVKNHGGDITVTSTPGEGTTFVVELPIASPPGN